MSEPNGSTDVVLNDKDPGNGVLVTVTLPSAITQAHALLLTVPSITSTSGFTLGGSPIGLDGTWSACSNPSLPVSGGNSVQVVVPAASAQVVHVG